MIGPAAKPALTHNRPDARGYEAARDVNVRAAASGSGDGPHARKAIARLNQLLESGVPLKRDVPRGYYLDIEA
jgi:hypothetical protein